MDDTTEKLTGTIIEAIIRVHQTLGPGFLEAVYQRALLIELKKRGLRTELEKEVVVEYDGEKVGSHRMDLVVDGRVIVEVKTVERIGKAQYAQVRSYVLVQTLSDTAPLKGRGLPVLMTVQT